MYSADTILISSSKSIPLRGQQLEMQLTMHVKDSSVTGVIVAYSEDKGCIIGYDALAKKLFIDRSKAGDNSFSKNFDTINRSEVSLMPDSGKITLRIYFDKSIIEVFANDGEVAMTSQLFPKESDDGIELFSMGNDILFSNVRTWKMKSIW
jgi:fructan beta-fructosidase